MANSLSLSRYIDDKDIDMDKLKRSLIKNYIKDIEKLEIEDIEFLIAETKSSKEYIDSILEDRWR